jgi:hypothetical protein
MILMAASVCLVGKRNSSRRINTRRSQQTWQNFKLSGEQRAIYKQTFMTAIDESATKQSFPVIGTRRILFVVLAYFLFLSVHVIEIISRIIFNVIKRVLNL